MYGRAPYEQNCVAYEQYKSKDQVIDELKSYVKHLEQERTRKSIEWMNTSTENIMLKRSLANAQEEIAALKEKKDSSNVMAFKRKIRELEEERDRYRLLYDRMEWKLKQIKSSGIGIDLFKNCNSQEELAKRKKALLSIFHPDCESGDNEVTCMILAEYDKKMINK